MLTPPSLLPSLPPSLPQVIDRFYAFLSSLTILCGQIKGQTRLPMPPIEGLLGPPSGAGDAVMASSGLNL